MRFKGGYTICLAGRPGGVIQRLPHPDRLLLPRVSARLSFSEMCVEHRQRVYYGDCLARDPHHYGVPLLAPSTGTVSLSAVDDHIVLEDLDAFERRPTTRPPEVPQAAQRFGAAGINRFKLVTLGAWPYFSDARTGEIPDPLGRPQAVIVSTVTLEPFMVRGDVLLRSKLLNFTRGLKQLQTVLEYQPIYLVIPNTQSEFAALVKKQIRGYAWVTMVEIPCVYPHDSFRLLARKLGLKPEHGPTWALHTEGILALDTALTSGQPCITRIIAVGGPEVSDPSHVEVVTGYPMEGICDVHARSPLARVINGGLLTGDLWSEKIMGLDSECRGLTILPELEDREFLGFVRPGWNRRSYAPCYLSALRKPFGERLTTAVRGEPRPCISCGYCEDVCPAGIMPHLIHKHLYRDGLEEAERARVDLCVECGLCTFLCPSKIDLCTQFVEAKTRIRQEKEELRLEEKRREEERLRGAAQHEH